MLDAQFKSRMKLFRVVILPFTLIPIGLIVFSLFQPRLEPIIGREVFNALEFVHLWVGVPIGVIAALAWGMKDEFAEAVYNFVHNQGVQED